MFGVKKSSKIAYFIVVCLALSSCSSLGELCSQAIEQKLNIRFRQVKVLKNRLGRDSIVTKDTFLKMQEVRITGILLDSNFISKTDTSTNAFTIPLNPYQDAIQAILLQKATPTNPSPKPDTLVMNYTRNTQLISAECGSKTEYANFRPKKSTFYDLKVTINSNQINPNVEVYFLYK